MRYTPPAVELFSLIPSDIGRPLTDLTHRLEYPEMERDAKRALGELLPAEREVRASNRWYIARALPYRSADERIGGVVFTFVDITARRRAEDALQELQAEQAADLAAMLRLQDFSARLLGTAELPLVLRQALDATVELQRADFGSVQLYNRASRKLEIVAHRGFDNASLERIRNVNLERSAASGRAITNRERVIVEDVNADSLYEPLRDLAAQVGYRAVQSTPLFDRNNDPLGVLTTHFRAPHRPSDRELRLTDLYARQAADVIGFKLTEQSLRDSEERFRAMVEQTALGVGQCAFTGRSYSSISGYAKWPAALRSRCTTCVFRTSRTRMICPTTKKCSLEWHVTARRSKWKNGCCGPTVVPCRSTSAHRYYAIAMAGRLRQRFWCLI